MCLSLSKIIGRGGNSMIWLDDETQTAIKKVKFNSSGYSTLLELVIGKSFLHENICEIIDIHREEDGIYFSMPIADCNLKEYCQKQNCSEEELIHILYSLCKALNFLHSNSIIHGDIKPANILMFGNVPKLSDFGSSILYLDKKISLESFTKFYRAPEVWKRKWDSKADVWALGCTIYEIKYNRILFPIKDEKMINFDIKNKFADNFLDILLMKMLEIDPEKRFDISAVLEVLENYYNITEKINRDYNQKIKSEEILTEQDIYYLANQIDFLIDSQETFLSLCKLLNYPFQKQKINIIKLLDKQEELIKHLINLFKERIK